MTLLSVCEWLGTTRGSIALHESLHVFLIVLGIHVLTLCVFVGTAVLIDLRLLGLALRRAPASEVVARLLPWTGAGFLIMIVSGALLFYADPVSRYQNIFFRLKMAALVLAVANAALFHRTVFRRVAEWDVDAVPPRPARIAAAVSLVLWAALITFGRMIPYQKYWFEGG
ncbi:MAG: hypothetical protein A3H29_02390 [Acidobacteria bacterium RIFCSPLOWO2_02_FULL_67_21]|nr:MAG: hypothetical protein A3H29_02390 [Acidobacteria bacterium RIFCSPLOWO2_02_FULL_67_21]